MEAVQLNLFRAQQMLKLVKEKYMKQYVNSENTILEEKGEGGRHCASSTENPHSADHDQQILYMRDTAKES